MKTETFPETLKNAFAALILCILFYIFLPFVLTRFFPHAADLFADCRWVLLLPSVFIVIILCIFSRQYFFSAEDFCDIAYGKIILYNTGIIFLCGIASFLWLEILDILKIKYDDFVPVEEIIRKSGGIDLVMIGILTCAVVPFVEEIIFRRIIFSGIMESGMPVFSNVLTSMLFAILHGILFQMLPLFVLGVYFQTLYTRTGKLGASFFAHALNNSFAFSCLLIFKNFIEAD